MENSGDKESFVCGDNEDSKMKVMEILRDMWINPVDRGLLHPRIVDSNNYFIGSFGTIMVLLLFAFISVRTRWSKRK